jgi:hypothetical protein
MMMMTDRNYTLRKEWKLNSYRNNVLSNILDLKCIMHQDMDWILDCLTIVFWLQKFRSFERGETMIMSEKNVWFWKGIIQHS